GGTEREISQVDRQRGRNARCFGIGAMPFRFAWRARLSDLPPDTLPTVFYERHLALGGRMVPFAGHALPVQYKGLIAEHAWTRESASLFDVSHMGQIRVRGRDHSAVAAWLERLTPADLASLAPGEMRYTVLLNPRGGIEDDLIVTRPSGEDSTLDIVVNAARRLDDLEIMRAAADDDLDIVLQSDRALLALQGPKAAEVLARHSDLPERLGFMQSGR